ncbi:uncharacterized protein VTP21DRAFT_9022 [Calcarisporiella thermophila]|uniref:uncharacterized protein n=1 Tax=Calcarisporiella thermophila TaxID=911321 RepID=UPI0037440FF6
MLVAVTQACETLCWYTSGEGYGYCDYACKGGHNFAYNFASALRRNGYKGCSVVGSAETDVHCNNMSGCKSHTWKSC